MENIFTLNLDNLSEQRFRMRLERLRMGLPVQIKSQRARDAKKRRLLVDFYLKTTPEPEDVLSGKVFRELLDTT